MSSIILIGAPGAGKGTQRAKLVDKYGFKEIIPGDLMREEVKNKTKNGLILADYINKGLLAPHELAMEIVTSKIQNYYENNVEHIIFDGFPREIEQFEELNNALKSYNCYKISHVFYLKVNDYDVKSRIKNRSLTSGRLDDLSDDIISKRLNVFYDKTMKVINKYKEMGLLIEIDASRPVEDVFNDLVSHLNNL